MTNESKYVLDVGEANAETSRRGDENYNPDTQVFLLNAGLQPGMRVLDVACGEGIMTHWLAKQVGKDGRVHAIDENDLQLKIAKKNTSELDNVFLENRSVYTLGSLTDKFDFIYSRFLLIHLDQPERALRQMFDCLNPGGTLALVSGICSAYFCEPRCNSYYTFFDLVLKMLSKNGSDPHWGRKLLPQMKNLGLEIKAAKSFMPIMHTRYEKETMIHALRSLEQKFSDDGLSPEELAFMYQEFDALTVNESSCFSVSDCIMVAGKRC